jgi:UMF1 family MFS transporter
MYDWANSAYNLVITSTIFPFYFLAITGDKDITTPDYVSFWGWELINNSLLNYALAFAYFIVALISPILSSIADYQGSKKKYMQWFTYFGATACCGLFFFKPGNVELGIILAIMAAIGYSGSIVFNNAYLPEIAEEKYQDKLSAQGFAYGYVGSVLLQILCVILIKQNFADSTLAARLSFLAVGLWWLIFSQIPFRILPDGTPLGKDLRHSIWYNGFHELKLVWHQVQKMPLLKRFLAAYFFYSMGVQTVMLAAAGFASKEIQKEVNGQWVNLGETELIGIIVVIQLVAIAGAFLMARLSTRIGNLRVLMLTVFLWIGVCVSAYYTKTDTQFYILAAVVGLVMGGIQSLSRSTFSKMMPETKDTSSFFSFYNVAEKIAIAIGLASFGFIESVTGNMRNSIFALGVFFIIGFILLWITERKRKNEGIHYLLQESKV